MMTRRLLSLVVAACTLLLAGSLLPATTAVAVPSSQDAPATVPYGGRLADAAGQPVADGVYAFRFTLYAEAEGGDPLWSETQENVTVTGGEFATLVGSAVPLPAVLPSGGKLWLLVAVRGQNDAGFTDLLPRQPFDVDAKEEEVAISAVDADTCPHTHLGETWTANSTTYALRLYNNGTGDGIRAYSKATANNFGAVYAVNSATTGAGNAVYGSSTKGNGVRGVSIDNVGVYGSSGKTDGVMGQSGTALKSGVYGFHSANGYGVFGRSTSSFGLGASGAGDGDGTDAVGDLLLGGTRGEIFSAGDYLNLYSNFNINADLDNNNNNANACLNIWKGNETLAARTCEDGTKSAIVETASSGTRAVYAMESPEVWLEDFGSATLVDGVATVTIDPVFAEMINTSVDYHVFFTPLGDCNGLYVADKGPTGFTVMELGGGASAISFDWRLVAKRVGLEDKRMEVVDVAAAQAQK